MKKRIALLDDHKLFLEGVHFMLSKVEEFQVIKTANNGNDILKTLKDNELDLVITDISMPEMNGVEFIARIKKIDKGIKIIVLSMFESLESYKNIDGYLLKDCSEEELLLAIHTVLDNKSYFPNKENKSQNLHLNTKNKLLTKREIQIVKLIIEELTADEIADKLSISRFTIDTHKKNIFLKLGVKNNAGLTKKAMQIGLL